MRRALDTGGRFYTRNKKINHRVERNFAQNQPETSTAKPKPIRSMMANIVVMLKPFATISSNLKTCKLLAGVECTAPL